MAAWGKEGHKNLMLYYPLYAEIILDYINHKMTWTVDSEIPKSLSALCWETMFFDISSFYGVAPTPTCLKLNERTVRIHNKV